jgi:hypothetical protein
MMCRAKSLFTTADVVNEAPKTPTMRRAPIA